MIVINSVLGGAAVLLLIPAAVYFVECMVAVFRGHAPRLATIEISPRVAVVIPANDEEGIIGDTVRHIKKQLTDSERLIVIADNCTDSTACEAADAGAEVWERHDAGKRGKGYAISFAVDRLTLSAPDVVVFIDADCRLAKGTIDRISRAAIANQRPIQSKYQFVAPPGAACLGSVSALACLVRNLVRPLGLHHLGLPCHLTGSGMAFPWHQIRKAPGQKGSLVEDLSLGLDLAMAGHEPMLCSEAGIASSLPQARVAAASQRRRWEHGQMATFVAYAPRLIAMGIKTRRPTLIALAADLAVPPLALLVTLICLLTALATIIYLMGGSSVAVAISATSLGLVFVATVSAWAQFGRDVISMVRLMSVPLYIFWKLPAYFALLTGKTQKDWIRTDRSVRKPKPDEDL